MPSQPSGGDDESDPPSPFNGFPDAEQDAARQRVTPSPVKRLVRQAKTAAKQKLSSQVKRSVKSQQEEDDFLSDASLGWDDFSPLPTYALERGDGSKVSTSTVFSVSGHLTEAEDDIFEDANQGASAESTPNTSCNSGGTVVPAKMPDNTNLDVHLAAITRAELLIEDDLNEAEPGLLHYDVLASVLGRAQRVKIELQEALIAFAPLDISVVSEEIRESAKTKKATVLTFIRAANTELFRRQQQQGGPTQAGNTGQANGDSRSSATRLKRARVTAQQPGVVQRLQDLTEEIRTAMAPQPESDIQARALAEKFQQQVRRAKGIQDDCNSMLSTAIELGMEEEVNQLDNALADLKNQLSESEAQLSEYKQNLGIIGESTGSGGLKTTDLKAPVFSGEPGGLDFFTFFRDFNDYVASRNVSRSEVLRFLQRTCLEGPPKEACRMMTTKEEIFAHLRQTYGNPRILFHARVDELKKLGACKGSFVQRRDWAIAVKARLVQLNDLAADHDLQEELWFSPIVAELQAHLPDREIDEYKKLLRAADAGGNVSRKATFKIFFNYLDTVVNNFTFDVNYSLNNAPPKPAIPSGQKPGGTSAPTPSRRAANLAPPDPNLVANPTSSSEVYTPPEEMDCKSCPGRHAYCFYCPVFIAARVKDRFGIASKARACFRCLRTDSAVDVKNREDWLRAHKPNCQTTWTCQHPECQRKEETRQLHLTMCSKHINYNKRSQEDFVKELDNNLAPIGTKYFACFPRSFNYHVNPNPAPMDAYKTVLPDVDDPSIFLLHDIQVNGRKLLVFFDSGCMGAGLSFDAAQALESKCVRPGPTWMHVAGGGTIKIDTGDEQFHLMLRDEKTYATMTALKMKKVTTPMPVWELKEAFKQITDEYNNVNPGGPPLPQCADQVGGQCVDIMVGIRYNRYFPELLYTLPGGLGIYQSRFACPEGNTCVLGGPHEAWRNAKDFAATMGPRSYLTAEARAYFVQSMSLTHLYQGPVSEEESTDAQNCKTTDNHLLEQSPQVDSDADVVCSFAHCERHQSEEGWIVPDHWQFNQTIYSSRELQARFKGAEETGAVAEYRCVRCRNCPSCRQGEVLEKKSLMEEVEQFKIEESVEFLPEQGVLQAKLPFLRPPGDALSDNTKRAAGILQSQLRVVARNEDTKADAIASYKKLLDHGHIQAVHDLPPEQQKLVLNSHDAGYIMPWRLQHNPNSLSTPVRLVFDGSCITPGGDSLNGILPKGENKLCKIINVLLRFRKLPFAYTADVKMAYNGVKLHPDFYRYQKFLWKENLDPANPTNVMVVKTLIYGIRPSGNQMSAGFRKLANYVEGQFPEYAPGARVLRDDTYVDDAVRSEETKDARERSAEGLKFTLAQAGLSAKSFTFNNEVPDESVSADGKHVGVLGLLWNAVDDAICLDIKPLFFGKCKRGKRPELVDGDIGEALGKVFTRRTVLGKTNAIYDPLGLVTPITAKLKLDMHELCIEKLDWDDPIPAKYLSVWVKNLEDISNLREIYFARTVIPPDAASLTIDLIVSSDASKDIAVACVHTRVLKRDGSYHVQLFCAKSRLVSKDTIPKGELSAAAMGAVLGHVARTSLGDQHGQSIHVLDSTIALHWINTDERPLHTAVRNLVIEIRRFTDLKLWYHIETNQNVADIGTRGCEIEDIGPGTAWQCGYEWMRLGFHEMPIRSVEDVILTGEERRAALSEQKGQDVFGIVLSNLKTRVADRYKFSRYAFDPNRCRWDKAVHALAYIIRFVRRCHPQFNPVWKPVEPESVPGRVTGEVADTKRLTDQEIKWAEKYFFHTTTKEVIHFVPKKEYEGCSVFKDGILLYTSRILSGDEIDDPENVFPDLKPLQFVVPLVERYSPVAYSIMLYAHGVLGRHRSAVSTLLESRGIAFILHGRSLAIEIRDACPHCKRYKGKLLEIEMGRLHESRLKIAPAFYHCQVDIFGPLTAHHDHYKRHLQAKCYGLIFKCTTTTAIAIHAMADYTAESFCAAYTRFASVRGNPTKIYIDAGSQLVKACKTMDISIVDLTQGLSQTSCPGLSFEVCPVGGHNANGMVERSVQEVRKLMTKVYGGLRLDLLTLETCFAWVANELNCLPICLGSRTEDLDHLDVLTPSRLLLGRNNRRALGGAPLLTTPSRMAKQVEEVQRSWFKIWQEEKLCDFVPQPRGWPKTSAQPAVGDIVVFVADEGSTKIKGLTWRIGRVLEVTYSKDGVIRQVKVEYKNSGECVFRTTTRSARRIAVVHHEGDLDVIDELNAASKEADTAYFILNKD